MAPLGTGLRHYPLAFCIVFAGAGLALWPVRGLPDWLHAAAATSAQWLGGISVIGLVGVPRHWAKQQLRRSGIDAVDAMTGTEFEHRLAVLFAHFGHRVELTPPTGDFGADLVLTDPCGDRTVVQAKRYQRGSTVGEEAVQQVVGARAHYGAQHAMVVTNTAFTRHAIALAASNGVELVGRRALVGLLARQGSDVPPDTGLRLLVGQVVSGVSPVANAVGAVIGLALWGAWQVVRFLGRMLAL